MPTDQGQIAAGPPMRLTVGTARFGDVRAALRAGLRDTLARPVLSLSFGVVFAALGAVLIAGAGFFILRARRRRDSEPVEMEE